MSTTTGTHSAAEGQKAKNLRERASAEKRTASVLAEDSEFLDEEAELYEKEHAEKLNRVKFELYKDFAEGRITRGALDRRLEQIELKENPTLPPAAPAVTPRQPEAEKIVSFYEKLSAASGLVPFPIVDTVALTAIQVRMIKKLASLYGVKFSDQWVSTSVTTLLGTLTPSYFKALPGIGTAVGVITGPAFNYAATRAVGKVFIQQFESGGTIFSLNPAKMKAYFADYYSAAKN
jgi:uncharacterized protein (DUF697 family)